MNEQKSGFLIINKPVGPTSHDIIAKLRRITGIKKIGHAGTLDPFASGVLVVAVGREATKEISQFVKLDKEYIATLVLGVTTDTYDNEGVRLKVESRTLPAGRQESKVGIKEVEEVLKKFIGEQKQVPPMFSAKKINGKKLYELARKGIEVKREPVDVNIFSLELIEYEWPILKIRTKVSSGTYIRSLGHDIGQVLGCGAYLDALERTAVDKFFINDSVAIHVVNKENWVDFLLKKE